MCTRDTLPHAVLALRNSTHVHDMCTHMHMNMHLHMHMHMHMCMHMCMWPLSSSDRHEWLYGLKPYASAAAPVGLARSLVRHLVKVAEERIAEVDRHGAQREPSRLRRVAAQVERVDVVVAAGERADGNRLGT
jgi:hypothetical protein